MRKIFLAIFILSLLWVKPVSAHLAGQPPYFKVNGVYSSLYQVPTTSLDDFMLPQDISPQNFVVGDKVDFEIDKSQLPVLPSIIGDTKFYWEFGDGEKGEGLTESHVYKKPGSFFLIINAQYQQEHPQLLQSMLINILPNKDYKLPKAVIKADDFVTKDPLTDFYTIRPNTQVSFDSSGSDGGSSKIESYFWDFGDGAFATDAKASHSYDKKYVQIFPVLRIKTTDGFIADSYMEIKTDANAPAKGTSSTGPKKSSAFNIFIPIGIGVILFIIIVLTSKRLKKTSK